MADLVAACANIVGRDEEVIAVARARLADPSHGLNSFVIVHAVRGLSRLVTRQRRRTAISARVRAAGFPMAVHMVLVATATQLTVVESSSRWTPRTALGAIPRGEIQSLTLPRSGDGSWKVAELRRQGLGGVRFMIEHPGSAALIESFA